MSRLESTDFNKSKLNAFVACGYDEDFAFNLTISGATALHDCAPESED